MLKINRTSQFKTRAADQAAFFANASAPVSTASTYMFLQLQENLGWDWLQRTMLALHKPQDQRQGLERLAAEYSRQAGRDLSDFLSAWRLPVTSAVRAEVSKLGLPSLAFDPAGACGAECTQCCIGRNTSSNPAPPPPPSPSIPYPNADYAGVLAQHNAYRAAHSTPPLAYNATLAAAADAYAAKCNYAHDASNQDDGENLHYAAGAGPTPESTLAAATVSWYDEIKDVSATARERACS